VTSAAPVFLEPDAARAADPSGILAGCIESGARAVLMDEDVAPADFFDLSTRMAGELLHGLGKYGIRLAVVIPDVSVHSPAFQDFAREANRRGDYRFFASRGEAVEWLGQG
jgi:hypothetical protein